MILHGRLLYRNYWCRRRPRYLIFSQFSIYCCQNAFGFASDPTWGLPAPPAGKRWVSPLQRAPQNCGPQGLETPRSATVRGYNIRGDAGRCCTKAPYYASNERAGEGGLEVGDQVYTWVRPRWRDEIQMICATQ